MPREPPKVTPPRLAWGNEEEIRFKGSSVISSDPGVILSGRESTSSVDEQLSTEPIPACSNDWDQLSALSPRSEQETQFTLLSVPVQTDSANSGASNHQVKKSKSKTVKAVKTVKTVKTGNDRRRLRLYTTHQSPYMTRAREGQAARCIGTLDGSVDGPNSAGGVDDDDDEYQLPESANDEEDSELSTINEIRKITPTPKTANRSKLRGGRAAKTKRTPARSKKVATNQVIASTRKRPVILDEVVRSSERLSISSSSDELLPASQNVKATTGSSQRKKKDVIPDSQDLVKDSQENAVPLISKSRAKNSRRSKKPFDQDSFGAQQINPDTNTSVRHVTDIHQQSTARPGIVHSAPCKKELRGNGDVQANSQRMHTTVNTSPSEATQLRGDDGIAPRIDKGKGRAIDQTQPFSTVYERDSPPTHHVSDQLSQLDGVEYEEMHGQESPSYYAEAKPTERHGRPEHIELPVNGTKVTPITRESFEQFDYGTQTHLPPFSSSPTQPDHVVETMNDATQTKNFGAKPLLNNICHRVAFEEAPAGSNTTGHRFLRLPQQDASGLSQINPLATAICEEREQAEKSEKDISMKKFKDLPSIATPLHPTSRAWAQEIAKRSRQDDLKIPSPKTNAGGNEPLCRTLHENQFSKRETALKGQRDAIAGCIQGIIMEMLQRLTSNEFPISNIVETYQQSGHHALGVVLDCQSTELAQAASNFEDKRIRLGDLFYQSSQHAETMKENMSKKNKRYLEDRARRQTELEKTIKLARDTAASL